MSKRHSLFYDSTSGEILSNQVNDTSRTPISRGGQTFAAEFGNASLEYYSGGVKTARPAATASFDKTTVTADAVTAGTPDAIVISNLTIGAEITVIESGNASLSSPIVATATTHTFQFATPGSYLFKISDFPKLPLEQTVTAT